MQISKAWNSLEIGFQITLNSDNSLIDKLISVDSVHNTSASVVFGDVLNHQDEILDRLDFDIADLPEGDQNFLIHNSQASPFPIEGEISLSHNENDSQIEKIDQALLSYITSFKKKTNVNNSKSQIFDDSESSLGDFNLNILEMFEGCHKSTAARAFVHFLSLASAGNIEMRQDYSGPIMINLKKR